MAADRADCCATTNPFTAPVAPTRRLETAVDKTGSMVPVAPTAARADDTAKTLDVIATLAGTAPLESKEAIREAADVLDL